LPQIVQWAYGFSSAKSTRKSMVAITYDLNVAKRIETAIGRLGTGQPLPMSPKRPISLAAY